MYMLSQSWSVRSKESSCSHLWLAQFSLGFWSENSNECVHEFRWFRGSVLGQSYSKGVVDLDHSGFGLVLSKTFLSWMYVQKGNVPVVALAAKVVWGMN